MAGIPAKRLLVYIVSGLVVLAVGSGAVMAMRSESLPGGDSSSASAVKISAVGGADGSGASDTMILPGGDPAGGTATQAAQTTTTTKRALIFVQVAGAVRRPGVYEMPPESRVFQAIDKAGGFTPDADEQAITLAACLSDGCRVYVPRVGETAAGASVPVEPTGGAPGAAAAGPLSINSAGVEELDSLPGIGPAIAQDIVTYREANGPFASVDELTEVPGIGPSKLEQLRPLVTL
jgi:competence protein ComEA